MKQIMYGRKEAVKHKVGEKSEERESKTQRGRKERIKK
jgi:hypothetical protein